MYIHKYIYLYVSIVNIYLYIYFYTSIINILKNSGTVYSRMSIHAGFGLFRIQMSCRTPEHFAEHFPWKVSIHAVLSGIVPVKI